MAARTTRPKRKKRVSKKRKTGVQSKSRKRNVTKKTLRRVPKLPTAMTEPVIDPISVPSIPSFPPKPSHLRVFKAILNTLLFVIIIAASLAAIFIGKKDINGYRLFVVKSGSMEPTIPTGSLILSQPQPSYGVGDVVTYGSLIRKDSTITHRIVDVKTLGEAQYFVTKGDANPVADDQPIPPSGILGKHQATIPLLGYPIGFASEPLGAVVLIIVPATIVLWEEIKNLRALLSPRPRPS